eukprot:Tamp_16153.p1 GENE.Tamp_16153~~Tamp_16153.p1  ORF type:complete len:323 (-),score=33.45 Tamp_16153:517-1485(-)
MRQAVHRSSAVSQCITRELGNALARRWLSLKNTSLPAPTDPPQRMLELSQARRVSIMDAGSGRLGDVLCVHGCPGSGFDFRYLGAELERAGMRVIRVDLPGNDRTPLQATEGMGDPADGRVLGALVTEIADKLNLAQPLLLAHSVGSQVAMNAAEAAEDERFLGLALVNPAPVLVPHRMIRPYWLVHAVCRLSVSIDSVSFLRPIWRFLLKKVVVMWGFTPKISEGECAFIMTRLLHVDWWDQKRRASALRLRKVPTLMVYTKDDPMIEEHLSHELSQTLASGPRLVFPNGGHFANKWHAEPIAAAIIDFASLAHMNREAHS